MGLAHEKTSYLQKKANLFEIGSIPKNNTDEPGGRVGKTASLFLLLNFKSADFR